MIILASILTFIGITVLFCQLFPMGVLAGGFDTEADGLIPKIRPLIRGLAKITGRIGPAGLRSGIEQKLVSAGQPYDLNAEEFIALKVLSLLFFTAAFGLVPYGPVMLRILLGLAAFWLPDQWINDQIKERRKKILRLLPGFIDLLTLAVEAGMDFMAALNQVIALSTRDPLIDQFRITLDEIKFGTSREDALRAMAARVDLPELTTFISSLIQANKLGTPLGKVLRIQAEEIRKRRMMLAEKMGQEASVKIILPLVAFIFPCVLILLIGPLFIQMMGSGF